MAYLVKCPLCGRDVSSETNSCPGCGHDVAKDLQQKAAQATEEAERQLKERQRQLEERLRSERVANYLCVNCGNDKLKKESSEVWESYKWHRTLCPKCGWKIEAEGSLLDESYLKITGGTLEEWKRYFGSDRYR